MLRHEDLSAEGLRVLPTGAEPHGDIVGQLVTGRPGDEPGDLDALITAVQATRHRMLSNPFYREQEEMP